MRQLLVFATAILLAGCVTGATASHISKITYGMSKEEVVNLLGTPDSTSGRGPDLEGLTWKQPPFQTTQPLNFCVWLSNGRVVKWGDIYCQ